MRILLRATWTASLALSACSLADRDLPAPYRRLDVPVDRLGTADFRNQGRLLYRRDCVLCHGDLGDGRGVRAADLTPPPQDFSDPAWQARNDERHLYYIVAEGRRGTAMAGWKPTLSRSEIWSVVAYIRSLGPPPPGGPAASDSERPAAAGSRGPDR